MFQVCKFPSKTRQLVTKRAIGLRVQLSRIGDDALDHRFDLEASLAGDWQGVDPLEQRLRLDDTGANGGPRKLPIALAAGNTLCEYEVVRFQAIRNRRTVRAKAGGYLQTHEPLLPARGRLGCLRPHAVGVEAVCFVKRGAVTKRSVDLNGLFWR
jgi:hypothetical protein